ncbi:Phage tail fiber assembly protein [Cronobacter condimenti 1330]|uniref:Phage tail fiber assembly protein n=1 Tax=Cronobacter condimenti 1330 TaxID=1073999 RepID=K7ZZ85_9ENTR|nr:tail fiber assembly protein [Cronobacter condimenti]ALB64028.1 phage tail protein [Cronobacter condimenti 1330]CCJ71981.1 Phage tail fiber assembly protein [Cronobacter condimenti 1330]
MAELFDKNGNATETTTVTVYGFDQQTGEYQNTYKARILAGTGIPGFSTMQAVPESKAGYTLVWNGKAWQEREDHRGKTAYEKATGDAVIIKALGLPDDEYTLCEPATPYDKWNGTAWVTDTDARHAADVVAAEQQKSTLLAEAATEIEWRQYAVSKGIATEEELAALDKWNLYRVRLMRIVTSQAPEIEWPGRP